MLFGGGGRGFIEKGFCVFDAGGKEQWGEKHNARTPTEEKPPSALLKNFQGGGGGGSWTMMISYTYPILGYFS